jgi:hypothetical protein
MGPFVYLAVERVLRGGCSVIFLRQYGNVNGDQRSATGNVIKITSDRTAHRAENNPLCSQIKQPDIRNFPYTHGLQFRCTVRLLPEGFESWPIQH